MNNLRLKGVVVDGLGEAFTVRVNDPPDPSLAVLHLDRAAMNGARVGDDVELKYHEEPARGWWHVHALVDNSGGEVHNQWEN